MFENQIIFGGIYRSKDIERTWSHTGHPDLHLNDQRYNIWIPVRFNGNNYVKPGIYMIDTYQAPYFNTNHYPFEKLVERMISYGENGDNAYYSCGNYYYNSRVRLTDEVFEEFELIADLREWREISLDETYQYAEADVLRYIRLYHEHRYPYGICLVEYLGSQYGVYVSGWDDTTGTWEEAIIVSLAESLAQDRSKNKSIGEENSRLKTIPPKTKAEQAKELCKDYFGRQYLGKHVVLVVWDDPIVKGALSHRSGCFEEFFEAELFAQALKEEYSKMVCEEGVTKLPKGSHATIYLDGSVYAAI